MSTQKSEAYLGTLALCWLERLGIGRAPDSAKKRSRFKITTYIFHKSKVWRNKGPCPARDRDDQRAPLIIPSLNCGC